MPRKNMFTREQVVDAAVALVREQGAQALTARALGAKLGTTPKPIFGLFPSMEAVRSAVIAQANRLYESYLEADMKSGKYPPYKASGMGYIRFARQERELFKLLFMRDRSRERVQSEEQAIAPLIALIQERTGLDRQGAYLFHLEMWMLVHGIATMIATSYTQWDEQMVSRALTDVYQGLVQKGAAHGGN